MGSCVGGDDVDVESADSAADKVVASRALVAVGELELSTAGLGACECRACGLTDMTFVMTPSAWRRSRPTQSGSSSLVVLSSVLQSARAAAALRNQALRVHRFA